MGKFSGTELSAEAFGRDFYAPTRGIIDNLFDYIVDYQHEIRATGGFYSATMKLHPGPDFDVDDWFDNGLNRRIVVKNPGQTVIWEGFVNKISVNDGSVTRTRGNVTDIINSINASYILTDPSTTIPLVGIPTDIGVLTNAESIAKYGTVSGIIDLGERTATEALQIANYYLAENAFPTRTTVVSNTSSSGPLTVTLGLKGFWNWLFYPYNDTAGSGVETVDDKIKAVLAADPNSHISTDYTNIDVNASDVVHYENRDRPADSVIESMIMTSDGSYTRYTFGIYADRIAYYKVIPNSLDPLYRYDVGSPFLVDRGGSRVAPWDIVPAQWMNELGRRSGAGRLDTSLDLTDPNATFIESVKYKAPYSFSVNGGRVLSVAQGIARYGLGGTAV